MHNTPHLVVSISSHGFGHVAQTAPVLNRLHKLCPRLRITVRSAVAYEHLRSRIRVPFMHLPSSGDIGMVMSSALEVDVERSRAEYRTFHSDWNKRVTDEAILLHELQADMVFSNVGYLPLAGAQAAGIANAALCSLNWADIYRHYCGDTSTQPSVLSTVEGSRRTADETIMAQIHASYANADAFLRATPGMAMIDPLAGPALSKVERPGTGLANLIPVAPIATVGKNRRDQLNSILKLSLDEKLVLVSMGGIKSRVAVEGWPGIDGVRWLVQKNWQACPEFNRRVVHPDVIYLESLPMSFSDLLASSDALICKPGYGSFVEAACSGVPVLYVGRADWPESPALIEWLQFHGLGLEISRDALERGHVAEALEQIWCAPKPEPVVPMGVEQVASWIAEKLG